MESSDTNSTKKRKSVNLAETSNDHENDNSNNFELIKDINETSFEMFTTMEDMLSVPVELLFAKIPLPDTDNNNKKKNSSTNENNDRKNLMTKSEYNCFIEVVLLSQKLDAISTITCKAMERKIEYQFLLCQLPKDPYLVPYHILLRNLSTIAPDHCIQKTLHEFNTIKEQLQSCVIQLRRDYETNWETASLLNANGAHISGDAKNALADIQEELYTRIEKYILMTMSSPSGLYNPMMENSSELSDIPSMKDYCVNLLPWIFQQNDDDDNGKVETSNREALALREDPPRDDDSQKSTDNIDDGTPVKKKQSSTTNGINGNDNNEEPSNDDTKQSANIDKGTPVKDKQSSTTNGINGNDNSNNNAIEMDKLNSLNDDDHPLPKMPESESSTQKRYVTLSTLLSLGDQQQNEDDDGKVSSNRQSSSLREDPSVNDTNKFMNIDMRTPVKSKQSSATNVINGNNNIKNSDSIEKDRLSSLNDDDDGLPKMPESESSTQKRYVTSSTLLSLGAQQQSRFDSNDDKNSSKKTNQNDDIQNNDDADDVADDDMDDFADANEMDDVADDDDMDNVADDNAVDGDVPEYEVAEYDVAEDDVAEDDVVKDDVADDDDDDSDCVCIGVSPAKPKSDRGINDTSDVYPAYVGSTSTPDRNVSSSQHVAVDVLARMQTSYGRKA